MIETIRRIHGFTPPRYVSGIFSQIGYIFYNVHACTILRIYSKRYFHGGVYMLRGRRMLFNTMLLTTTSLLMRTIGMVFQVYLSKKIGASGIGLFQLIMSVSALASTFAISGIRFAATRIISEELGRQNEVGVKPAVLRCTVYALVFGFGAMAILFTSSEFVGTKCIGDIRTVLSLRLLSLSLPCLALSAVFGGYFTAVCRVVKSSVVAVAEQIIRITVIVLVLVSIPYENVEIACAAIVVGNIAGEISSFLLLFILYLHDIRRYRAKHTHCRGMTKRMLSISLPLALSSYARTALSTLQNLLIPKGLKKSGSTANQALADYGMIGGMVFPVITFPSALFYSLSELLVPELTDAQVKCDRRKISLTVNRTLQLCMLLSLCIASILFYYSEQLGMTIYSSREVGRYIRILSFLMPVMYLDSVTDGMLRGLGQHMYSMYINIADSILSVLMVYFLVPKWAIYGYLFMICFTEVFNFCLSIKRLASLTTLRLSARFFIKSTICAIGSVNIATLVLRKAGLELAPSVLSLFGHIVLSFVLYYFLLKILRCTTGSIFKYFKKLFK